MNTGSGRRKNRRGWLHASAPAPFPSIPNQAISVTLISTPLSLLGNADLISPSGIFLCVLWVCLHLGLRNSLDCPLLPFAFPFVVLTALSLQSHSLDKVRVWPGQGVEWQSVFPRGWGEAAWKCGNKACGCRTAGRNGTRVFLLPRSWSTAWKQNAASRSWATRWATSPASTSGTAPPTSWSAATWTGGTSE